MTVMDTLRTAIRCIFVPPPSKEAIAAREHSDRTIEALDRFTEQQDILGNLVRKMKGEKRPAKKRTARK